MYFCGEKTVKHAHKSIFAFKRWNELKRKPSKAKMSEAWAQKIKIITEQKEKNP